MKCLIINGSPRRGNTWKIVTRVKASLQTMGDVTFEEVQLMQEALPFCLGCNTCFYQGEARCPHAAVVAPIMRKMAEADALILTSPVYAMNMSALLKNFFDHTAYQFHRPAMFAKKALVITSTAGAGAGKVAKAVRDTLKHWGFNRVYTLTVTARSHPEMSDKAKQQCDRIARAFYDDVLSGKRHPPTFKRVMYYNAWRKMGTVASATKPDSAYWATGDRAAHVFAPDVPVGPVKKAFGHAIHKIFSLFMR